jgi:hypothetical protein
LDPNGVGGDYDNDKFRVIRTSIDFLKSFGSLKKVLQMIEEGDQGEPLKARIRAIREDQGWMRILEEEWSKQPEADYGFCTDSENEDDSDGE